MFNPQPTILVHLNSALLGEVGQTHNADNYISEIFLFAALRL
jgi:hypothetical protein